MPETTGLADPFRELPFAMVFRREPSFFGRLRTGAVKPKRFASSLRALI